MAIKNPILISFSVVIFQMVSLKGKSNRKDKVLAISFIWMAQSFTQSKVLPPILHTILALQGLGTISGKTLCQLCENACHLIDDNIALKLFQKLSSFRSYDSSKLSKLYVLKKMVREEWKKSFQLRHANLVFAGLYLRKFQYLEANNLLSAVYLMLPPNHH